MAAGAWTVRPTLRVTGWRLDTPGGGAWFVRGRAETVEVTGPDGATTRLQLASAPTGTRAMMAAGALVAALCALVILRFGRH